MTKDNIHASFEITDSEEAQSEVTNQSFSILEDTEIIKSLKKQKK